MIFVFYFLWFVALGKILLGPTTRLLAKLLFLICIGVGTWIIVGGFIYQSKYSEYLAQKSAFEAEKRVYIESEKKLEDLATIHPTSRDVLLRLATIAYQMGDTPKLLGYIETLRSIDPNDEKVKQFIHSTQ